MFSLCFVICGHTVVLVNHVKLTRIQNFIAELETLSVKKYINQNQKEFVKVKAEYTYIFIVTSYHIPE